MIQRETEEFLEKKKLQPFRREINLDGERYEYFNLDGAKYEFFGCAGNFKDVVEDYEGYCNGKWPYLCISLINAELPYFKEGEGVAFQVLSVSPQAIVHTSPIDIKTPWSSAPEQPGWYAATQRIEVLADHIDRAFNQFQIARGHGAMSTEIDQALRLNQRAGVMAEHFEKLLAKADSNSPKAQILQEAITLLRSPQERKRLAIDQLMIGLGKFSDFSEKDIGELNEILHGLHHLEQKYPHFKGSNFSGNDSIFNRVTLQLLTLINHYKTAKLSEEERKEEFKALFQTDDPDGKYDILGELEAMQKLIQRVPESYGNFAMRLNRLMGPHEVISEMPKDEHNEFNIDTKKGRGIEVKAWMISSTKLEDFATESPENQELLKKIFKRAKKENIPIVTRTNVV